MQARGRERAGTGALLLAIVLAHALFGLWLARHSLPPSPPTASGRIELVLIEAQAAVRPPPSPAPPRRLRERAATAAAPATWVPERSDAGPRAPPPEPASPAPVDARTLLRQAAAAARAGGAATAGTRPRPRLPGREDAFVEGIHVSAARSPQQWVAAIGSLLFGAEDPCVDLMRRRRAALDVYEILDVEWRLERRNCRLP